MVCSMAGAGAFFFFLAVVEADADVEKSSVAVRSNGMKDEIFMGVLSFCVVLHLRFLQEAERGSVDDRLGAFEVDVNNGGSAWSYDRIALMGMEDVVPLSLSILKQVPMSCAVDAQ